MNRPPFVVMFYRGAGRRARCFRFRTEEMAFVAADRFAHRLKAIAVICNSTLKKGIII